jgi:hypothetical protein
VHVNAGGIYFPETVNGLAYPVLAALADDPFQCPETLRSRVCRERYGRAADRADAGISQATDANALLFQALGVSFLWQDGRITTVDAASAFLEAQLKHLPPGASGDTLRHLLSPTEDALEELRLESEAAHWLLRQSRQNALSVIESEASLESRLLGLAVARNEAVTSFCNTIKEAFLLTRLYAQDVSPATRDQVESTLSRLPELAASSSAALGSGALCEGLDEFTASVRTSMDRSDRTAPLAVAFRQAEQHARQGHPEEAAQALHDILHDPALNPHLEKNKKRVAALASALTALWSCPENLRVLRGADGRWTLVRKAGRWALASTEKHPCIYFDVQTEPLEAPADYTLRFEYYDEGDFRIWVNYDSHYPGGASERQYHAAEPVQLENTGTWRTAERTLTQCRFGNGQNENADMRIVGGKEKIIYVRNVALTGD